ncbi:MAG: hypothetical protein LBT50_03200 [Prevotellaceae bacterium]|jgi:hypothetical protein|nr:hypothetical protein [Prevotellaceae bacterium]
MIFDNIRRNISQVMLFALIILLLFYSGDLFFSSADKIEWNRSIFSGLPDFLHGRPSIIISMLLTLISGLLIYKINFDHLSINSREHLLVWLWIIQVGGFSFFHQLTEVHFAVIFILLSYDLLFYVNSKTVEYKRIFLSAMYLGIATLFYNFSIYLFVPYIVSLYRFKIAGFRDWIISIAGFITPFYFAIFSFFFFTGDWYYPIETTVNNIIPDSLSIKFADMSLPQYLFCAFIAALIIIEILTPRLASKGLNQKTISCISSFSFMLFFSLLISLIFNSENKFMLHIIFIPTTILLRILFFKITKNIIANLLFIALITIAFLALL